MNRALARLVVVGSLLVGIPGTRAALGQYGPSSGSGGNYAVSYGAGHYGPGYGGSSPASPYPTACGVQGAPGYGYSGYAGGTAPAYNPNLPYSPAQQQGYREGRYYWETGVAPGHHLSPAEARGFYAGEFRAASTPWQLDPARQQGYREGQIFWETGLLPNHRLTPAEAQGFQAGERRAASGGYRPY